MSRKRKVSRVENSQFLLTSNTNYTTTYYADHAHDTCHDADNRYLADAKPTPILGNYKKQQLKSPALSMDFSKFKEIYFERSPSCG